MQVSLFLKIVNPDWGIRGGTLGQGQVCGQTLQCGGLGSGQQATCLTFSPGMAWNRPGVLSLLDEGAHPMPTSSPCSTLRPTILLQWHRKAVQSWDPGKKPQAQGRINGHRINLAWSSLTLTITHPTSTCGTAMEPVDMLV